MKIKIFQTFVYQSKGFYMQVAKKGDAFLIYVLLARDPKMKQHKIPPLYQDYKYVFKKKWHLTWALTIWLHDQPWKNTTLFGPIYNFSQDELATI